MPMQEVKRTAQYRIYRKSSGRYAVRNPERRWINGDDKAAILLAEGLIEPPKVKRPAPETAEAD